jgi:hypothetical protein
MFGIDKASYQLQNLGTAYANVSDARIGNRIDQVPTQPDKEDVRLDHLQVLVDDV